MLTAIVCCATWRNVKDFSSPFQHFERFVSYFLPDDEVVEHCTSAEKDPHADDDARRDGRGRRELEDRVQHDVC